MSHAVIEFAIVAAVALAISVAVAVLHYEAIVRLGLHYGRLRRHGRPGRSAVLRAFGLLFGLHVAEIWMFGLAYWGLLNWTPAGGMAGAPDTSLLDAMYLSAATFPTVGFGDVAPQGAIRLLAGTEALIGFMLITWSAAFMFFMMEAHWRALLERDAPRGNQDPRDD